VDLGRARAALARLAVPARRQIAGRLRLDLMDGVEDDHALGHLGLVVDELALLTRAAPNAKRSLRHLLHLRFNGLLELGWHVGDRCRLDLHLPARALLEND